MCDSFFKTCEFQVRSIVFESVWGGGGGGDSPKTMTSKTNFIFKNHKNPNQGLGWGGGLRIVPITSISQLISFSS